MEITLTESNSLKIISGNYTLVTNPITKNNFKKQKLKSTVLGQSICIASGEFECLRFTAFIISLQSFI